MFLFFFFKQKTAYEMRISDWSSDVCSSDLVGIAFDHHQQHRFALLVGQAGHSAIDVGERNARLLAAVGTHRKSRFLLCEGLRSARTRPAFVDPDIAHYPVPQPIEPRPVLQLVLSGLLTLYFPFATIFTHSSVAQ